MATASDRLSEPIRLGDAEWLTVPDTAGAYVIYDRGEVIYVGMAGVTGRAAFDDDSATMPAVRLSTCLRSTYSCSESSLSARSGLTTRAPRRQRADRTYESAAPSGISRQRVARRRGNSSSNSSWSFGQRSIPERPSPGMRGQLSTYARAPSCLTRACSRRAGWARGAARAPPSGECR
jgi:hypothetical protein